MPNPNHLPLPTTVQLPLQLPHQPKCPLTPALHHPPTTLQISSPSLPRLTNTSEIKLRNERETQVQVHRLLP